MNKKVLKIVLIVLALTLAVTCITACGGDDDCAHDWKITDTVTQEPTCETTGVGIKSCTKCGKIEPVEIPTVSTAHVYSREWSSDTTHHWHASTCSHELKRDYGEHILGLDGKCQTCQRELACAHNWIFDSVKPSTCEVQGETIYKCSKCSETQSEPIELDPNGHTYEDKWSSDGEYHWHASTCSHEAKKNYGIHDRDFVTNVCKVCGLGCEHDYEEKVINAPTCDNVGHKKLTCKYCGIFEYETIPVDHEAHSFESVYSHDQDEHWFASTCSHDLKKDVESHDFNDNGICKVCGTGCEHVWIYGAKQDATCQGTGLHPKTCEICGFESADVLSVNPDNHVFAEEWSKDKDYHWKNAVCGHDVKYSYEMHNRGADDKCVDCGKQLECLPENHAWDEGKITKQATCKATGEIMKTCTKCNKSKFETLPVDDNAHKFNTYSWASNDTHHWRKSTCGHDVKGDYAEHTRNEKGTCTTCGRLCAHDWDYLSVTASTCETHGSEHKKCLKCGYEVTGELAINPNAHTYSSDWEYDTIYHWHKSTCAHEATSSKTSHNLDKETNKCKICDYVAPCVHVWDGGKYNATENTSTINCTKCGEPHQNSGNSGLANIEVDEVISTEIPEDQSQEIKYYKYKISIDLNSENNLILRKLDKSYYMHGEYNLVTPTNKANFEYIGGLMPKEVYEIAEKFTVDGTPLATFGKGEFNASGFNQRFYNFIRFLYISTNGQLLLSFEYDTSFIYQTPNTCFGVRGRFIVEKSSVGGTTYNTLEDYLSQIYTSGKNYVDYYAMLMDGMNGSATYHFAVDYLDIETDTTAGIQEGDYVWCDVNLDIPFMDGNIDDAFWNQVLLGQGFATM